MAKGSNLIRLKDKDARTGQGMKIIIPQIKMSNIKLGRQILDNYNYNLRNSDSNGK